MGYSCTVLASKAEEWIVNALQVAHGDCGGTSNSWGPSREVGRFAERGRERPDGSITGSVYSMTGHKVGAFRVAADGVVELWPGTTADMRREAAIHAVHEHIRVYGWPRKGTYREDHPAAHLLTASFVCV